MYKLDAALVFTGLLVAKGGKPQSLGASLRQAGYSESYARNPQKIKKTKKWKEMIATVESPEVNFHAIRVHRDLMEAKKLTTRTFPAEFTADIIQEILDLPDIQILSIKPYSKGVHVTYFEPDLVTRGKALDMVYKIRGLYKS